MKINLNREWNRIPHSTATNSYELLQEVAEAVKAEPRRLYMPLWQSRELPKDNEDIQRGPICGTVGCFAGWIANLTVTQEKFSNLYYLEQRSDTIAFKYLPDVCHEDANRLFLGTREWSDEDGDYVEGSGYYPFPDVTLYGTSAYVEQALSNLYKFMDKWEATLKAFAIVPPVTARS